MGRLKSHGLFVFEPWEVSLLTAFLFGGHVKDPGLGRDICVMSGIQIYFLKAMLKFIFRRLLKNAQMQGSRNPEE